MTDRSPRPRDLELRLGLLTASFQRYPRPATGLVEAPPRSHGALPIAVAGGQLLVPLPDGEALWVGLVARSPRVHLIARIVVETDRGRLDVVSGAPLGPSSGDVPARGLVVPPTIMVEGIAREGSAAWCFARTSAGTPACTALELEAFPARHVGPARVPRSPAPMNAPASGRATSGAQRATAVVESSAWRLDRRVFARVLIVAPDELARATGLPPLPPLRPEAAYRGWRLP